MSLNTVTFVGRAGRDAEIRFLDSGKSVANFTMAVNRRKKDAEPLWVKAEVWGKSAQVAADYVRKGGLVGITGEIDIDTWTDKQSGATRSQLKVTVSDLRLLGSKGDGQQQGAPASAAAAPVADDIEPPF